jgi:hypothetical protein
MTEQKNVDEQLKELEREQKQLERDKLKEELKQLRTARKTVWITPAALAALLPLVAGFGVWTFNEIKQYNEGYKALAERDKLKQEKRDLNDEVRTLIASKTNYANEKDRLEREAAAQQADFQKIKEQVKAAEVERDRLALQLAERRLLSAKVKLQQFFDKAAARVDTVWRICSRLDGVVTRSLANFEPDAPSTEQDELIKQLNSVFVPLIENDPYISSMEIVGEDGLEYVILDERRFPESQIDNYSPYTWRNRLMRLDHWGQQAIEWYWEDTAAFKLKGKDDNWNVTGNLGRLIVNLGGERKEIDYDPRYRRYAQPWLISEENRDSYARLWQSSEKNIQWTPPYIFYTTKTVGITASRGWKDGNGNRYVLAIDLTLIELSLTTTQLRVGDRGVVFIFTPDGAVIGLPHHHDFTGEHTEDRIKRFFDRDLGNQKIHTIPDETPSLLKVDEMDQSLGTDTLTEAFNAWDPDGAKTQTVSFAVHGESWSGLFEEFEYPQSDRTVWIAVIAPSSELIPSASAVDQPHGLTGR